MTQPDLARLEGLVANATPAPWGREDFTPLESDYSKIGHCNVILAPDGMSIVADLMKDPDIELVLAMHEALPALLARVRELEKGNAGLAEALEPFAEHVSHLDSGSHSMDLDADDFPATLYCGGVPGIRHQLTVGDLRRARAALTINRSETDAG